MKIFLGRIFRSIASRLDLMRSKIAALIIKLKYPSIQIRRGVYIGKRCEIISNNTGCIILEGTHINHSVTIIASENATIKIGRSSIGRNSLIAARESIQIGNDCSIAEFVVIRDQNHVHSLSPTLIENQGYEVAPITIGDNVWIGTKTTVLKGVSIGENSILGAHSLANKSIPPSSKYAGTPAKPI